ncbi:MAG: nucleotide exchange factor GrpE [Patescibacteria group bacterium]
MSEDTHPNGSPPEQDSIEALQATCEEYLNGWKRAKADFANAERTWRTHTAELARYAEERVLREMLEIADALDEAVRHTSDEGIEQIRRKILSILAREKVTLITVTKGDLFDPYIHEAISGEGEQIAVIVRNGYMHEDQVLRPVQVMVK